VAPAAAPVMAHLKPGAGPERAPATPRMTAKRERQSLRDLASAIKDLMGHAQPSGCLFSDAWPLSPWSARGRNRKTTDDPQAPDATRGWAIAINSFSQPSLWRASSLAASRASAKARHAYHNPSGWGVADKLRALPEVAAT
jgi:hypothetical protein